MRLWQSGLALGALLPWLIACGEREGDHPVATPVTNLQTLEALTQQARSWDLDSPLGYGGRTHLSICLDGAAGYDPSDDDVAETRDALASALANSPTTLPAEFEEWEVVEGCPLAAHEDSREEYANDLYYRFTSASPPLASEPSPHFVFVYLLPSELWQSDPAVARNDWKYLLGSAEVICITDACDVLSHTLFLPSDVSEEDFEDALIVRLGLSEGTVIPDPD
jgi:hypothetical protein